MIDLLILLLIPALKFLDNSKKYWYFFWAPLPAWLVDLAIARTTFALVAGRGPQGRERTVSDMLENLGADITNPDQQLYLWIGRKINRAVGFVHIKVAGL